MLLAPPDRLQRRLHAGLRRDPSTRRRRDGDKYTAAGDQDRIDEGWWVMGKEGQGVVFIHWYSTVFRSDRFQDAVSEIAPVAMQYGATEYRVYRARDDIYKFIQMATFDTKVDWERYWYSEEFSDWRAEFSSWYQVPVVPQWQDLIIHGAVEENPTATSPSERSPGDVDSSTDIMPGPFGG